MKQAKLICLLLTLVMLLPVAVQAAGTTPVKVTILLASNQGKDFDMDNDDYRDELIKLFAYSYYKQTNELRVELAQGKREIVPLGDDFELVLSLQRQEAERIYLQAVIRKGRQAHVDTVLSILKKGVVFVGGPETPSGTLIVVLETGM